MSLANPLVFIYDTSLSEGAFPNQPKVANVVPLYKCDEPILFNHYRPVSLLCTLSKAFEKVSYNRPINFLDKFSILYEYQFGRKRSSNLALIIMIDKFNDWLCPPQSNHCLITHWGRVMHISVSKLISIVPDNGLPPGRHQTIIWTNAGILLIEPVGTTFGDFFKSRFIHFHTRKCIWNRRLRNADHFVSASMC